MNSTLTKTKIYRPILARILNRFVVRMDRLIVNVKSCAYAYIKVCVRLEKTEKLLNFFKEA